MLERLALPEEVRFTVYLMLSFAFFVGILLMVSQEAFALFNKSLQREFGIRKRLIRDVEKTQNQYVDWIMTRYPVVSGLLISVLSFVLLLIYKV